MLLLGVVPCGLCAQEHVCLPDLARVARKAHLDLFAAMSDPHPAVSAGEAHVAARPHEALH